MTVSEIKRTNKINNDKAETIDSLILKVFNLWERF